MKKKTGHAELRAWARTRRDELVGWDSAPDDLLAFIVDEATYLRASFALHFGVAHAHLARTVEEILSEHAAPHPSSVRRWAGGK